MNYCPNRDCVYDKPIKEGEKCPECGTDAKPFGIREAGDLKTAKKNRAKIAEKLEKGSVQLLVTDEMTEEEIKKRMQEDMMNLAMHESRNRLDAPRHLTLRKQHRPDIRCRPKSTDRPKQNYNTPK